MTTRKSTPKANTVPIINSDEVRISNKEVIDQEIAKEQAKPTGKAKPATKPVAKPKPATKPTGKAKPATKPVAKPKPATKPVAKPKPATKPVAKPKEVKTPMFTRIQAVGIVMKANPDATKEVICNKADSLFIKKTSSSSNIRETEAQYSKAVNFLKGYNSK
jgi:outer membrane biosynthesis protein TonB